MSQEWLIAARAPGLGARVLQDLLLRTGGIKSLLASSERDLRHFGLSPRSIAALKTPDKDLLAADEHWLAQSDSHILPLDHEDYPPLLKKIASPPLLLFVRGHLNVLWQPQIAVIGSRNPTTGGLAHARDFAGELSRSGWAITSGLAAGIDVAAHQSALDAGGSTVAVLGTGPDVIYPRHHQAVTEAIIAEGALVTEFPPGTPARREHFPSRNRIISGMSLGVVVIEAALNSGSLITARLGAEQGREVFALPGSLHNPLAKGCHRLIKQGARLAESTADIIDELGPMAAELAAALGERLDGISSEAPQTQTAAPDQPQFDLTLLDDREYALLWETLGHDPLTADQLVQRSGLSSREVSSMLLMLELRGMVHAVDGGRFERDAEFAAASNGS